MNFFSGKPILIANFFVNFEFAMINLTFSSDIKILLFKPEFFHDLSL